MAADSIQVWETFRDGLQSFIAKRVSNEHDVEDILQDVFCRIHARLPALRDSNHLQAWVYQIARNAVVDHYRSKRPTVGLPHGLEEMLDEPADSGDASRDMASCLRPMIDDLPEIYRQAIILSEFEGLTQRELGLRLGLSTSGAKSRVQRARKMLKELLLECCRLEFDCTGRIMDYEEKHPGRYCRLPVPPT